MAKQTINIGAAPNDGTGTPLRTSFDYCNQNFTELYTATGPSGNNIVVPGSATITGDLTVDTSTLKVDSANNRVGIGTASPGFPLDIIGASGVGVRIYESSTGNNNRLQITQEGTETRFNSTFTTGSAFYTWQIAGSTAMTLNSTGLGVGVASPSYKLDVNSGATASAANLKSTGSSVIARFADGTADTGYVGSGAALIAGGARTDFGILSVGSLILGSNNARSVTVDTSGNVGIGVTPSYKFHALVASGYSGAFKASTAAITGVLIGNTVADLTVGVDASGNGRVTADTSKYLGLGSNGINDRATLDSAGNFVVGIAAVATTATDGFLYVTGCAGTPTGTPTAKTGRVPIVVDTTNNKLYFYSGGSWVAAN